MKQLTCEMCGATDLLKQDGVFVCQSCGTKYSVEEAKKMMIEGTVDVSGSKVKVDSSEEIENLYQIARRAKDSNNSENAAKYYDMILMKDPYSWEANFYTVYYKSMSCKIAEIKSAIANVENCIEDTLNLIKTYVTDDEKRVNAVAEVVMRTDILADMMQKSYVRHYNGISSSIRSNYAVEKLSVTIATTTAKAKPISCIIYLFADDEYLILNYGYEAIKNFLKDRDSWAHADAAKTLLARYDIIISQHKKEEDARKTHEAKKRFDTYWSEHSAEKKKLESEKADLERQLDTIDASLTAQISALNKEIATIPGVSEIASLDERIRKLKADKKSLSFFKGKEKKAIDAQIAQAEADKKAVQERMSLATKEIENKISSAKTEAQRKSSSLQNRLSAISEELTRER